VTHVVQEHFNQRKGTPLAKILFHFSNTPELPPSHGLCFFRTHALAHETLGQHGQVQVNLLIDVVFGAPAVN
jgi:hypothetical protein